MKYFKIVSGALTLGLIAGVAFNITYEKVSAIEDIKEAQKNKIVIRPYVENIYTNNGVLDTGADIKKEKSTYKPNVKTEDYIFIGDSRLDSLRELSSMNYNFITTQELNCDWLRNGGLSQLNSILNTTNRSYNIVFSLGIDDFENVDRYAQFLNDFAYRYSNHNIFVLEIGPLDEHKNTINEIKKVDLSTVDNDAIQMFNVELRKKLNNNVCPLFTFQELIGNGYNTIDKYYYDRETSYKILNFIRNHVESLEQDDIHNIRLD